MQKSTGLVISLSLLLVLACSLKQADSRYQHTTAKDSLITLFDLSECPRKELGSCLKKIKGMGPKLVVINAIMDESRDPESDSILSIAISRLDNVVMATGIDPSDLSIEGSAAVFAKDGIKEGALSYTTNTDSVTTEYIPLFQNSQEQALGLPHVIAFNYRPELLDGTRWFRVNEPVKISCTRSMANFNVVNEKTFSSELIQDRIVVLGLLADENHYVFIDGRKVKTNSAVITANLVLNILDGKIKPPPLVHFDDH